MLFYLGSYTSPKTEGIRLLDLDLSTGQVASRGLAVATPNAAYMALHPSGRFLYAVDEGSKFNDQPTGVVLAFAIDPATALLTLLNQEPSEGKWPAHISLDPAGHHALVANYGGGTVAIFPIGQDGRLGRAATVVHHQGKGHNASRQESPHPHSAYFDPAGRFVLSADLGIDKVMVYRVDPTRGTLQANDPPFAPLAPGAGPRHLAFHPTLPIAYLLNELDSTVVVFGYDAQRGALSSLQTIAALPTGFAGSSIAAEIVIHPTGRFAYASNRGHESIVIYAVDGKTGQLTLIGHEDTRGKHPRNFTIDPTGGWLIVANKDSENLTVFRVDPETGKLRAVQTLEMPAPGCMRFLRQ